MAIKLMFVANQAALDNGDKTQAAVLTESGALALIWVKKDDSGVIRKVITTSAKSEYTSVNLYERDAKALNLTEKETKQAIQECNANPTGSAIITVYRSSGAKDNDKTMTRQEQVNNDVARVIRVSVLRTSAQVSVFAKDFKASVLSDSGASVQLEGEYTL